MTDWQQHMKPEERDRLDAINAERLNLARETRRIYDRARKRAGRAGTKTDSSNPIQTAPADPQES